VQLFGDELADAGDGGEELLRALHVTSTFASWNVLRDNLGLSVDAARGVMARTVAALLGVH
jgi:hypothetical protein